MKTWYVYKNDQQYGPFADAELIDWSQAGYLQPNDLVWRTGMPGWSTAAAVPGLFPAAAALPHQATATPTIAPSPTPSAAPSQRTQSSDPTGEGRFSGSIIAFVFATAIVLIAIAWIFNQFDKEDALVLWTWIAAILIGFFALGIPFFLLFFGRRSA